MHEGGIWRGILAQIGIVLFVGYYHLWYLLSTIVAVVIIGYALHKKVKIEKIVIGGVILYIIGLLGHSYFELVRPLENTFVWTLLKGYNAIFLTTRNGFFEGILFVGMGALFAYKRVKLKISVAWIGFGISMVCLLLEALMVYALKLYRGGDMYACLAPAVFFLFYIVSHMDIKATKFTAGLRTYSVLIYFVHVWWLTVTAVINRICGKVLGVSDFTMHSLLRFVIVLTGAVVTSALIIKLQQYKPFRWLKKIY